MVVYFNKVHERLFLPVFTDDARFTAPVRKRDAISFCSAPNQNCVTEWVGEVYEAEG